MILPSERVRLLGVALLISTACVGHALAEAPAVDALVKQAQYWRSKGRDDLAEQAMRRARALNPKVQAPAPAPAPAPAKAAPPSKRVIAAPNPVALPRSAKPAAKPARVATSRPEPGKAPAAAPKAEAKAAPAPALSPAIRAGQARVAGYAALNGGRLDEAATQFQKALATNRKDPEALGGMGLVRLKQSRFDEAADMLEQASRLGRAAQWAEGLGTAKFFAGLGNARTLVAQNRLGDAQAAIEQLLRSGYKEPAPALELLGDVFQKQGRYADSAEAYRQAARVGGKNQQELQASSARSRAMAAAQRGDDLTADREFQNGLLLDRDDPWIRYEYSRFMLSRGRMADAEGLLRALTMTNTADGLYAAALLSNDLHRPADAERLIATIPDAQLTPQMRSFAIGVKVDSAIDRTRVLASSGQQAQAINVLRQLGAMPSVPPYKLPAIADALANMGDATGAATIAQNALDAGNLDMPAYGGLVGVLTRVGREDLAQAAMQRAAQLAGDNPDARAALARMGVSLQVAQADRARLAGQFAPAFDMLQAAYAAAPDNADVLAALARLYHTGNMPAKAAQTYQLVLARDPNNRDALLGLAQTAQAAGDNGLSEKAQDQVLRAYPRDFQVRLTLAQVERARGDEGAAVRMLKDARQLYTRGNTAATASNPFTGVGPWTTGNPFRDQPPVPGTTIAGPATGPTNGQVNPFALSNGTRLPQMQSYQGGGAFSGASYVVEQQSDANALFHAGHWDGEDTPPAKFASAVFDESANEGAPLRQLVDYPGQGYPAYPQQGYPQQQAYPQQQGYPAQPYPAQPYPAQSYPAQSYPAQAYPAQAYPQQQQPSYPPQQAYPAPQQYPAPQGYPQQQAYPQPQQAYAYPPQGGYPAQGYPTQAPAQGYPQQATPANWGGAPGAPSPAYGGDPVLAQIQSDIAELSQDTGPRAEFNTSYRSRSGEKGLSKLSEIKGSAKFSTGVAGGRVYARADAVVIDAGRPTGSGLARFGRNATPEAQAIVDKLPSPLVQAATQHDTGVAGAVGFESGSVQAEVGITPSGMGKTKVTFHAGVSPKIGNNARVKAYVERQPVTDSVVSYAGTVDPVSGERWGQVMRTGGGAGFTYDDNGNGFYAEARYNRYRGENVRDNHNFEANAGGYLRLTSTEHSRVTAGLNVNYQKYGNSQNYFTFGQGGYFSPQDFVSVSFPINYSYDSSTLELRGSVVPGFQSYSQDQTDLYPTDSAGQARLNTLKALNTDVRSYYDGISKTGFAVSANGSAYYRVGGSTRVGGEASYNTFGSYKELKSLIGVRQSFGSGK